MTVFFTRCSSAPRSKQRPRVISPSVKPSKAERLDSSLLRGSRGGSAASRRVCLGEHRGGEGATAPPHRFNYCDKVHKIALPLQNVCARRTHLNISPPKGQNISHAQSAYFTAAKRVFHRRKAAISHGGVPPYFTAKRAVPALLMPLPPVPPRQGST